jgi:hypothetical protein
VPLSEVQLIRVRRHVGANEPTDAELHAIYDRLGDVDELVLEVLEARLATLTSEPAQFAIPGEYSQSVGENIKALQEQLAKLGWGAAGAARVRIVEPEPRQPR